MAAVGSPFDRVPQEVRPRSHARRLILQVFACIVNHCWDIMVEISARSRRRAVLTLAAAHCELNDFQSVTLVCRRWYETAARTLYSSWQFASLGEIANMIETMARRPAIRSIMRTMAFVLPFKGVSSDADWSQAMDGLARIIDDCQALVMVQLRCAADPTGRSDATVVAILSALQSRRRPTMERLFMQAPHGAPLHILAPTFMRALAAMPSLAALNMAGVKLLGNGSTFDKPAPLRAVCVYILRREADGQLPDLRLDDHGDRPDAFEHRQRRPDA